jgi:hypothetical protein
MEATLANPERRPPALRGRDLLLLNLMIPISYHFRVIHPSFTLLLFQNTTLPFTHC